MRISYINLIEGGFDTRREGFSSLERAMANRQRDDFLPTMSIDFDNEAEMRIISTVLEMWMRKEYESNP
jgi:hypothetical protein